MHSARGVDGFTGNGGRISLDRDGLSSGRRFESDTDIAHEANGDVDVGLGLGKSLGRKLPTTYQASNIFSNIPAGFIPSKLKMPMGVPLLMLQTLW